jgi:hypothetical protein
VKEFVDSEGVRTGLYSGAGSGAVTARESVAELNAVGGPCG